MSTLTNPSPNGAAVTPSDSTTLSNVRALYIGGDGDVAVVMKGGASLTFTGLVAGMLLPVMVTQVKATGTTATNIIALN